MARNDERINAHVQRMGFSTLNGYQNWCSSNGFSNSLNKSITDLNLEFKYIKDKKALDHLKQSNQKITFKRAVELMKSNQHVPITHSLYSKISIMYLKAKNKDEFLELMTFLNKRTSILENEKTIEAVGCLLAQDDRWIRSWKSWEPKSYNAERQLSGFIRHLIAKYDVPLFMDHVWLSKGNYIEQDWFIHVAQGGNIIKADGFLEMYPMTKKMAHFFMQAPEDSDFLKAWRYGQIMSLGGNERLVRALGETPIFRGANLKNNEFFLGLMKFFIDNPMLDTAQIGPIVDYIWNQKFIAPRRIVDGRAETMEPPQPNFSMTGRTVDSLLSQVERWHNQLGKEKKGGNLQWEHWGVKDFELVEGSVENKSQKIWRINQLLCSKDLSVEGRLMKHCVASYAHSCFSGSSSIWSLSMEDSTGYYKYMTIEVGKQPFKIFQVRGICNRMPNQKESSIISRWAAREGIAYKI